MSTQIPDGYELLVGRSTENALEALSRADDRGFPAESVLTQRDGYLIPLDPDDVVDTIETEPGTEGEEPHELEAVESFELPAKSASKGEQEAFAAEHGIDLSETKNAEERANAIQAWADALPELQAEASTETEGN